MCAQMPLFKRFIKGSRKCAGASRSQDGTSVDDFDFVYIILCQCFSLFRLFGVCFVCILCVRLCGLWVRCSRLHASGRSERLAAESRGLRRQEIKHEMKTKLQFEHSPISLSNIPTSPR